MAQKSTELVTAPWLLASAVLVFTVALVEKGLNVVGTSLPFTDVYPSQLLNWAVTLMIFDIALTLRQMLEMRSSLGGGPSLPSR